MKTLEQVEREDARRFGRWHEDTNSYDELEEAKETVECACCGLYIEISEGETAHPADYFGDGKTESLCDKCYAVFLEEKAEEERDAAIYEANVEKIDKATVRINYWTKIINKINRVS
ncbi:MAG: hypothetical protein FWF53_00320 [Candidatus Azobacteroides sp.]|nr:hypothetical protein [Candidatus Azobacteroides sp.]